MKGVSHNFKERVSMEAKFLTSNLLYLNDETYDISIVLANTRPNMAEQ